MKSRVAIYGGTELSAAESWFVVSLTHALLSNLDVIIVTGGFHYSPNENPGAISTDFSVLQGARQYVKEKGLYLKDCLETWLPDQAAEIDPDKKDVVRFTDGVVKQLMGESAQERRFSMVRDVDILITVKGKKHTATVLEFALTINKPAFPLAFTNGDSRDFWNTQSDRVKNWFGITDDFGLQLQANEIEVFSPTIRDEIIKKIITSVGKAIELESRNQENYNNLQKRIEADAVSTQKEKLAPIAIDGNRQNNGSLPKNQLKTFLSYAHEDADLKNELDNHLIALKRSQKISVWQDNKIRGGDEWDKSIKKELLNADIILLLISESFLNSNYIWDIELPFALQQHEKSKAKVIPIYLRRLFTDQKMPFEKIKGYIDPEKPIGSLPDYQRDDAFFDVVKGISGDIDEWLKLSN